MATNGVNGSELILEVDTDNDGNFEAFAAQRDVSWSFETEEIEASNKMSPGNKGEWIPGRGSGTIDIEAVGVLDDTESDAEKLEAVHRNGTKFKVKQYLKTDQSKWLEAEGFLNSFELSFPDNDVFTISGTFRIDGEWSIEEESS